MKLIIIVSAILLISSVAFAQDAQVQYMYTDNMILVTPLYMPDGTTPIPDNTLIEYILPIVPDVKDYANDFHGSALNNISNHEIFNGSVAIGLAGFWIGDYFVFEDPLGSPPEPVINCSDQFYFRIYNAETVVAATHYRTSEFIVGPVAGSTPQDLVEVGVWGVWEPIGGVAPDPPVATAATTDFTLTFFANWNASTGATGYYLDVATDAGFTAFLTGYNDLDVGNVITYSVTALNAVDHYYRLRAYNANGTSCNSNVITVLGSTLPVELSAFTATFMDSYTLIRWVTASETDVIGFNIYRSTEDEYGTSDQINVNHIPGHGTTPYPNDYEFQDIDQLNYETTYYYWLESVNLGGSSNVYGAIEYTPEIGHGGFENDFDDNQLMNQPNPFSSTTTIKYAIKGMLQSEPVKISIYNTLGQLILEDVAKNGVYQFDASELPTGVYFYQLETESYNNIKKMMIIR